MFIGTLLSGFVKDHYTVDNIVNWRSVDVLPVLL
jgi:hypothetical protein